MGQAKNKGTFEERKAMAIKEGRVKKATIKTHNYGSRGHMPIDSMAGWGYLMGLAAVAGSHRRSG